MRIIDKNTDFYDYWQNVYKDNTFTFDRRDSFILTKEMVCSNLYTDKYWSWIEKRYKYKRFAYLLLQICNTFWLFLVEITEFDDYDRATNYNIELLFQWKDFDKPRELCNFEVIDFYFYHQNKKEEIYNHVTDFVDDIHRNNYKHRRSLNCCGFRIGDKTIEKNIPLLKACGVANCVDAHDVYLAFEEYFALEKSSTERREPLDTTDIDKIESHGFDKKTSFRGKI